MSVASSAASWMPTEASVSPVNVVVQQPPHRSFEVSRPHQRLQSHLHPHNRHRQFIAHRRHQPQPRMPQQQHPQLQRAVQSPTTSSSSAAAGGCHGDDDDVDGCNNGDTSSGVAQQCAGCLRPIGERYMLRAVDRFWHEDCLKCSCCDCRLGEVGSTLFAKADLLLCKRDYLRLFGATGLCSVCSKIIPAFELVMRAKDNVYHLECFACQQCNHRFCIGDRYYLCENKILCQFDYEERIVLTKLSRGGGGSGAVRDVDDAAQRSTTSASVATGSAIDVTAAVTSCGSASVSVPASIAHQPRCAR